MSPRIDAHVHFWSYSADEYAWIDDSLARLRRDFLPADAAREMAAAKLDGVIAVQARQSLAESEWLLALAAQSPIIAGVVGWVDLLSSAVEADLERLGERLCGVRHIVQAEPEDDFLLRPDFNRGIAALARWDLAYDILIFPRHLPATISFVDRHPSQRFVLDHLAKPSIRDKVLEPWRTQLRELARRPNVSIKLSGLVTEADWHSVSARDLEPYLQIALDAFGPERALFGSDYPVCTVAASYRDVHGFIAEFAAKLTPSEQAAIFGGNARELYRLPLMGS